MKTMIRCGLLFILLYSGTACAQPKTLNGVYAGVELTLSTVMGGGMNRNDIVVLFRPNGTYTDDLDKPDWQTRVTGRYAISGHTVSLNREGKQNVAQYTIDKDGDLNAGSFNLIKQPTDSSIPPGNYEFTGASSMGGGSSGMTYVGSFSNKGLYFDGRGNFASNSQSTTAISGDNIGGGGSRKTSGRGTYKISKGVLTLTYDNGAKEVHSFFCRPGYKPIMAVIDGDIFFVKDKSRPVSAQAGKESTSSSKAGNNNTAGEEKAETTDAKSILLKANAVHGGSALDAVTSASFVASMQGLQVNGYLDVVHKRARLEVRQASKLVQVEQVEGGEGWKWAAGKTSSLPAVRLAEMRGSFSSGILGLRKSAIKAMEIKSIKPANAGYSIIAEQDGQRHAFIINGQSRMVASADQGEQTVTTSAYSDFRNVSGVLIPFGEITTSGNQRVTIRYQKFDINPSIPGQTWAKP